MQGRDPEAASSPLGGRQQQRVGDGENHHDVTGENGQIHDHNVDVDLLSGGAGVHELRRT